MQAIVTKFIPCTNCRGSRIKAWCERGAIVIPYDHAGNEHGKAVEALCLKFAKEDEAKYGTPIADNPWMRPKIEAGLPKNVNGHNVYVFKS